MPLMVASRGTLRKLYDAQPTFRESAREDPDFESLRSDERFAALVA